MIKDIESNTLSDLKDPRVSILLVYVDGCKACEATKPIYEQLSQVYGNISYFKADLNKVLNFYVQYADKDDPVTDENGNTVVPPKIVAPMFYVFVKEEQSSENEYGWVGGIEGADINALTGVLEALNVVE